ncbi:MAG: phosphorylcholine transferase LicD [Breznakia sp.]
MKEQDVKKIQKIELEIFDEFQNFCKKYNLSFCLFGGTCLGAIRHQAMIPWDDDIDLIMPRNDYEKLIQIAKMHLHEDYFFQHFENEPNCGFVFGKVRRNNTILSETYSYKLGFHQGVWIDIFPCDNISDYAFMRMWDVIRFKFYQNMYIIKCGYSLPIGKPYYYRFIYVFIKRISKIFSQAWLVKRLKYIMTRHNKKQTKRVYPYGGAYGKREILASTVFENPILVDFENRKAKVFKEYEVYLTRVYGNYMELPPMEKRNGGAHTIYEFKDER